MIDQHENDGDGQNYEQQQLKINRTSSNQSVVPTQIDYRQYWDQVNFSEERRCKCCTLCTGKCNKMCCNDYCNACCCSKNGCKWTFAILLFVIFIYGTTGVAHRWLIFEEKSYDEDAVGKTSYPVCDLQYNSYLNVIDLVYLSISAHHNTGDMIRNDFNIWFGENYQENGWDIENTDGQKNPSFFHIYNRNYDIDVIAIGTEPYSDGPLLPDIALWSEVSMFQIFSWVVPLTTILPKAFIRQYIKLISIFEDIIAPNIRETFDEPIYQYVKEHILKQQETESLRTNDTVLFIIGHSLGGAIAQIEMEEALNRKRLNS